VKYLVVLLVVGVGLWMLVSRLRGPRGEGPGPEAEGKSRQRAGGGGKPVEMVECAHCGVHLAVADALPEGSRLYCSDAHRRLGPASERP
jgi:uncharacterized protein